MAASRGDRRRPAGVASVVPPSGEGSVRHVARHAGGERVVRVCPHRSGAGGPGPVPRIANSVPLAMGESSPATAAVTFVGAGVYEEVLFRLCLLPSFIGLFRLSRISPPSQRGWPSCRPVCCFRWPITSVRGRSRSGCSRLRSARPPVCALRSCSCIADSESSSALTRLTICWWESLSDRDQCAAALESRGGDADFDSLRSGRFSRRRC